MVLHDFCETCYKDPTNRTLTPNPKVHFFKAEDAPAALSAAKATDAQSKAGGDIGITK
jgi:hypothetical protein